jgi:ArsR family transcriptional regulator
MELVEIYEGLSDRTRLRILNLLAQSPLCVCHFQTILGEPQVKISKHLKYLRIRGMVVARRDRNWIIYALPSRRVPQLDYNMKCLQDCVRSDARYARDRKKLAVLQKNCCEPAALFGASGGRRSKQ